MKFKGPMLVVKDMERTKKFYTEVLGLRVINDLEENVTFTGGLSVQTEESWIRFTGTTDFYYGGNTSEMYFEVDDYDGWIEKVKEMNLTLIDDSVMPWQQKVTRLYDPDKHIIEIGENLKMTVRRLAKENKYSLADLSKMTMLPEKWIEKYLNEK